MMRTLVRLLAGCCAALALQIPVNGHQVPPAPPASAPRAHVLLLGTFHFRDAGADDYKPQFTVDMLAPDRQREIAALLASLKEFKPTRIAVEWSAERQPRLDEAYRQYRAGELELTANEIHQLGFRLAHLLGHDRVFAIDARARWYDPDVSTAVLMQRAQQHGQSGALQRAQAWIPYFDRLSAYDDKLKTEMSLQDFLSYLNSPDRLRSTLGRYLVGQIEVGGDGDYIGADTRTAWYNRNIRIFSNVQRMVSAPGERVLVVIGQGHVPILAHLFENAPEYELVAAEGYLGRR